MTQPLPYEPVKATWVADELSFPVSKGDWDDLWADLSDGHGDSLYVTLANGQEVVVRALSEDRKAARAEARRAQMLRNVE